ncbi:cytochrome p450 protein [Rutstroemia sp. NJR-2017a BVV2]|nr:cytochrome p450 protein [Rutstroemia sp. NJR-2017a BVV2]PQE25212.1 cytochrome p450 protein [Rutstroemia sp. NJR-2017a BVV2]
MSRADANLLIAFTASFIAFVATRFWRILCIFIHRFFSNPNPNSALPFQRQVILCNSASPESGLLSLVRLSWAWRHMGYRRLFHIFIIITLAVLTSAAFTVAGGFSSTISSAVEGMVLIDSVNCGFDHLSDQVSQVGPGVAWDAEQLNSAANYAQQCYQSNGSGVLSCGRFATKRVPWVTETNASCPFANGLCRTNQSNILLDTRHLDTNDIFGLNAPLNERLSLRNVLHCAPLITQGYADKENSSSGSIVRYHHGHALKGTVDNITKLDFTYRPMEDDWYRVTALGRPRFLSGTYGTTKSYMPEDAASPLGCVSQYQYCNLASAEGFRCGPLASFNDAIVGAALVFNSTPEEMQTGEPPIGNREATRLYWIAMLNAHSPIDLVYILYQLGAKSLASQSQLFDGVHYTSSTQQWQSDVSNWFAIAMASLQAVFVNTAIGPDDPTLLKLRTPPSDGLQRDLCNQQKIRSSIYSSFSLFGLCFIYTTGGFIILISFIIEPIFNFLHKRYKYENYKQLEWTTNQQLQLLRLAHEELGLSSWKKCTDFIPITERDELLSELDITQTDHPVIMVHTSKSEPEAVHSEDGIVEEISPVNTTISIAEEYPGEEVQEENQFEEMNEVVERPRANEDHLTITTITIDKSVG